MSSSALIECKNNKSSEKFEVNEPFLRVSERIISELKGKKLEEAINLLVGRLKFNDLCSHRLKVAGVFPDFQRHNRFWRHRHSGQGVGSAEGSKHKQCG